MRNSNFSRYKLLIAILFCFSSLALAQLSNTISDVEVSEAFENQPLTISATLLQPEITSNVQLAYRPFIESEFEFVDMEILANKASYIIEADQIRLPSLVYFLKVTLTDGSTETYPLNIPEKNAPLEITVQAKSQKDKEVIILSPQPGESVSVEDLFISVSLVRAPDNIDINATKILVDGEDITDKALIAGDLIIFYANNFPGTVELGEQKLLVEVYDTQGELYHSISTRFSAKTEAALLAEKEALTTKGSFRAESRNESFNEESEFFYNFTSDLSAKYSDWDFRGYAYLTSEESSEQQPRHRFFAEAKTSWMNIRGGDAFPRFPKLIMNGKRVRGISGNIELGYVNLKASYGQTKRSVDGELLQTYSVDELPQPLPTNIIALGNDTYGRINAGTFSRNIFALRPSFGSGENFQLGFTYFHSKDDPESGQYAGSPKENIVLGTDVDVKLDDRNIILKGSAAFSLYNNDISSGDLTDEEIDDVFGDPDSFIDVDPQTIKDIKSALGTFITVNENIGPLNPQELSSLGAEASLQLNYFNNNFKASYIYRGNEYTSFGQDFLRKDVRGINIADRIRVWDNRMIFTLGYEQLEDNLQKTKFGTTVYKTYNAAVSLFPRMDIPNITVSFSRNDNSNDINPADTTIGLYFVDYSTNRLSTNFSYTFDTGVKHYSNLNFTSSTTDDKTTNEYNASYISTSFGFNSFWSRDLNSYFSINYYDSEIAGIKYNYVSLSFGGKYKLLEDKLELKATITPTFGDLQQQVFDVLADYRFIENLYLALQFRLFRRPNYSTDSISGLTIRYNI